LQSSANIIIIIIIIIVITQKGTVKRQGHVEDLIFFNCIQNFGRKISTKGANYQKVSGVDQRITLKWVLMKSDKQLSILGLEPLSGCFKQGNEQSGSMKEGGIPGPAE
jgi:hypothetical protein